MTCPRWHLRSRHQYILVANGVLVRRTESQMHTHPVCTATCTHCTRPWVWDRRCGTPSAVDCPTRRSRSSGGRTMRVRRRVASSGVSGRRSRTRLGARASRCVIVVWYGLQCVLYEKLPLLRALATRPGFKTLAIHYLAQQGPLPLKMAPGTVCQCGNDGKQYSSCFCKADFERTTYIS